MTCHEGGARLSDERESDGCHCCVGRHRLHPCRCFLPTHHTPPYPPHPSLRLPPSLANRAPVSLPLRSASPAPSLAPSLSRTLSPSALCVCARSVRRRLPGSEPACVKPTHHHRMHNLGTSLPPRIGTRQLAPPPPPAPGSRPSSHFSSGVAAPSGG